MDPPRTECENQGDHGFRLTCPHLLGTWWNMFKNGEDPGVDSLPSCDMVEKRNRFFLGLALLLLFVGSSLPFSGGGSFSTLTKATLSDFEKPKSTRVEPAESFGRPIGKAARDSYRVTSKISRRTGHATCGAGLAMNNLRENHLKRVGMNYPQAFCPEPRSRLALENASSQH